MSRGSRSRTRSNPREHLKAFLIDRLRSFGLVIAIGVVLMVSLAVTAALAPRHGRDMTNSRH
jgi:hypothetical protein